LRFRSGFAVPLRVAVGVARRRRQILFPSPFEKEDMMQTTLRALWADERGFLVSAELILVATLLVIGLIAGLSCLQGVIIGEFQDLAFAFASLNQSFRFPGFFGCKGAFHPGSFFFNRPAVGFFPGVGFTGGTGLASTNPVFFGGADFGIGPGFAGGGVVGGGVVGGGVVGGGVAAPAANIALPCPSGVGCPTTACPQGDCTPAAGPLPGAPLQPTPERAPLPGPAVEAPAPAPGT
jgi:Flp pilus assembly pilin Flp